MNFPIVEYQDNDTVINEISVNDKEGRLEVREKIDLFQEMLEKIVGSEHGEMDEINQEGLTETLIDGVYIRHLLIPKDKFIVSKIWKIERFWIIESGEVTFCTEMGVQRVKSPFRKVVPSGSKVALYTHEDTSWFAISKCKANEIKDVEEEVVTSKYEECTYPWDMIEVLS